ncbi:MAG TPA: hypothetical protein VE821_05665, partial [Pyrinomonadaceae bacterium]|nr:hypothetical protein [Pyrinomonadaceae bacterium]
MNHAHHTKQHEEEASCFVLFRVMRVVHSTPASFIFRCKHKEVAMNCFFIIGTHFFTWGSGET